MCGDEAVVEWNYRPDVCAGDTYLESIVQKFTDEVKSQFLGIKLNHGVVGTLSSTPTA